MNGKGFGNHVFLNDYIKTNKVRRIMEIGVYNGENAKNMIKAAKQRPSEIKIEYYGFDTFDGTFNNVLGEVKSKISRQDCKFMLIKGDTRLNVQMRCKLYEEYFRRHL